MGLAFLDGFYIVASQSSVIKNPGWVVPANGWIPHSLVCLDLALNLVSEGPVEPLGMGDLHDILVHEGKLWAVDTKSNRVVGFEVRRSASSASVQFGASRWLVPVVQWQDPAARDEDATHVNSICAHDGRLLVSVFGRYSTRRAYDARGLNDGCILDITDHLSPFGSSTTSAPPPRIRTGLADPHSLISHEADLYFTEARRGRVVKDFETLAEFTGTYVRGLLIENGTIFVGCSSSRHCAVPISWASRV
ncbi:MAG: DUF4915 domain-containing protein, partial [Candidatus Sulfotelmatobacter sp.]